MKTSGRWMVGCGMAWMSLGGGCVGGDARVELAAADALEAVAVELGAALDEYHGDVSAADDARQRAAVSALSARLRVDAGDEQKAEAHAEAFHAAMARLLADREVAGLRRSVARENLTALRDTADGLRRVGVASLSLEDEMKRYLMDVIAARREAAGARQVTSAGVNRENGVE